MVFSPPMRHTTRFQHNRFFKSIFPLNQGLIYTIYVRWISSFLFPHFVSSFSFILFWQNYNRIVNLITVFYREFHVNISCGFIWIFSCLALNVKLSSMWHLNEVPMEKTLSFCHYSNWNIPFNGRIEKPLSEYISVRGPLVD